MARTFLDDDVKAESKTIGFSEGFQFGFGQFMAWALGIGVVGGTVAIVIVVFKLHV